MTEGEIGGWIESEKNLAVYGDAQVYGNGTIAVFHNIGSRDAALKGFAIDVMGEHECATVEFSVNEAKQIHAALGQRLQES